MRTLAALAVLALLAPACAFAVTIHIDGVSYTGSHNVGGAGIVAANGAVTGIDWPGDWVSYPLPVAAFGTYGAVVRCWGIDGISYSVRMIVEDMNDNLQTIDINFVGKGLCGH